MHTWQVCLHSTKTNMTHWVTENEICVLDTQYTNSKCTYFVVRDSWRTDDVYSRAAQNQEWLIYTWQVDLRSTTLIHIVFFLSLSLSLTIRTNLLLSLSLSYTQYTSLSLSLSYNTYTPLSLSLYLSLLQYEHIFFSPPLSLTTTTHRYLRLLLSLFQQLHISIPFSFSLSLLQ